MVEESPTYEFVPCKFGGFCFTSYADKRRLAMTRLASSPNPNMAPPVALDNITVTVFACQ